MVMKPDAYGLISGQNPNERLKNRKLLLQPVPDLQRHLQAVQHRLNHVKKSHNPSPKYGRDENITTVYSGGIMSPSARGLALVKLSQPSGGPV